MSLVFAGPQYEQSEKYGAKNPRINREQWTALNPHGQGSNVPEDIQRQWESFFVSIYSKVSINKV